MPTYSFFKIARFLVPLIPLAILWTTTIILMEKAVPSLLMRRCDWHKWAPTGPSIRLAILGDPQLIDNHTYPGRPDALLSLSQYVTDRYHNRNWLRLHSHLHPDLAVFVGDLLDNGREPSSEAYWYSQFNRFHSVFPQVTNVTELAARLFPDDTEALKLLTQNHGSLTVPGNHDIGWADMVRPEALKLFKDNFGYATHGLRLRGYELVLLDSISLSNTNDSTIFGPPRELLTELSASYNPAVPRILVHHVPLWKEDLGTCGPSRETSEFPRSRGYQYQTMLDPEISQEILTSVRPIVSFAGDDHDFCRTELPYHMDNKEYKDEEYNVKSMSMAMQVWWPAIQLLWLRDDPANADTSEPLFVTRICYLPPPFLPVALYVGLAFLSGAALLGYDMIPAVRRAADGMWRGSSERAERAERAEWAEQMEHIGSSGVAEGVKSKRKWSETDELGLEYVLETESPELLRSSGFGPVRRRRAGLWSQLTGRGVPGSAGPSRKGILEFLAHSAVLAVIILALLRL